MSLALELNPMAQDRIDPEAALLSGLRAGEPAAFEQLVRQHQTALVRFAQRLVGDADEASDVAQETFIRAFERIGDFRGASSLYTWLYRIAYHQAISLLRRRKVRRFLRLDRDEALDDAVQLQLIDSHDAAAQVEQQQALAQIDEAIQELPPRQRGIFIMRHYEGMTHAEIAQVVGRSEGAIRAGYFHAVRKLRDAARASGMLEEENL